MVETTCLRSKIWIGNELFPQLEAYLLDQKKKAILLCDERLKKDYAMTFQEKLGAEAIFVPSGESCKSEKIVQEVLEALFLKKIDRNAVLIGLGGGSLLDLAGFVASIYLRGIHLIFYPTTLLAIVDAAIGGKTAINCSFGKNLIGSFYPAHAIFCDCKVLKSLPTEELLNGDAEILKMGLIYDPLIFQEKSLEQKIIRAIQAKIEIVEKDPQEKDLRKILNFGHTIAHGLEMISSFQISHGKAVAMGSLVEAFLSYEMALLSHEDFLLIQTLYEKLLSDFSISSRQYYERVKFRKILEYDKKQKEGKLHFILLEKIGKVHFSNQSYATFVPEEILEKGLNWMENRFY